MEAAETAALGEGGGGEGPLASVEHGLQQSAAILSVLLLLLVTSVANIVVLWCRLSDVISLYLISLSFVDLLTALLIVPFSLYSSLRPGWAFAGDDSVLCKCTAYVQVVLVASTVFTLAWISVDRYAAFMKPSRYEVVHTATRCKCWIMFSWITALLVACPILITKMEANYAPQLELCVLNWSSTLAYSATLGVLVLVPSMCTVVFTSSAILVTMNKPDELEDLQRSILETDQNFVISLFILISFLLSWLPLIAIQFLPAQLMSQADSGVLQFAFTWLALGGGSSKLLIYSFTSKEFRRMFCCCLPLCRSQPSSRIELDRHTDNELGGIPPAAAHSHPRNSAPDFVSGDQAQPNALSPMMMAASLSPPVVDYGSFGLIAASPSQQNHRPSS